MKNKKISSNAELEAKKLIKFLEEHGDELVFDENEDIEKLIPEFKPF